MTKNFKKSEFACPCCGKDDIHPELVQLLQMIRDEFGKPMVITSGVRCEKHNREVGGKEGSAHLTGEAADISCHSASDRFWLLNSIACFCKRYGIAKDFIHVDISKTLPQEVTWLY